MNYIDTRYEEILEAMRTLNLNADELFSRIREDLERGLVDEARGHLNFIDGLVKPNANSAGTASQ